MTDDKCIHNLAGYSGKKLYDLQRIILKLTLRKKGVKVLFIYVKIGFNDRLLSIR